MTTTLPNHADTDRLAVGNSLIAQDWEDLTFKVHRSAYRENAVFNRERNEIWGRTWLYLGHETEIPVNGDFKTRTIGGRPLIFVRDSKGEVRAYLNACPHRGTILCRETEGRTRTFQCFYHAWAFRNARQRRVSDRQRIRRFRVPP
jgi:phenylpropionate dioxygenase-like ring-hydroxylating dioxygenase large terminal subunit